MSEPSGRSLSLQDLPELRRKTEAVSRFLRDQIATHLETLRPLFAPERIFGKHAGGKLDVQGSQRAMAELQQSYKPFTSKPYDLPETLDPSWLGLVGNALDLHAWEYLHPVQGKPITITSPIRWLVNYRCNYSLAQVKAVLAGKEAVRHELLRQFVVNSLVLQLVVKWTTGLVPLFRSLRLELTTEAPADLQRLPALTITSSLASFRPPDDLIQAATAFSGVPAFIELLDLDGVARTPDPLQVQLDTLLNRPAT